MKVQGSQPEDLDVAYIHLNDNEVEYQVVINEDVIADLDEDDCLVGLELLSLKEILSLEDIELLVDINWDDEEELESALWDLGAYARIQRAFGNSVSDTLLIPYTPTDGLWGVYSLDAVRHALYGPY